MRTFLHEVVEQLDKQHGDRLPDLCLVVPTRRAVVFLREALSSIKKQTFWAPRIIAIQDFVRELSGWHFPEALPLIFKLYQSYLEKTPVPEGKQPETFDRFYTWGEMLLKDFDEIDKYCVEPDQLFTNIKDLREIESAFSLPEEKQDQIRSFWGSIRNNGEEETTLQENFLRIWSVLYEVYTDFRKRLASSHTAYDGMAYRYIADKLEQGEIELPYYKTVFIGFNALNKAEERIIEYLLVERKAMVFWDADPAYTNLHKGSQAAISDMPGKFIQAFHHQWNEMDSHIIHYDMLSIPKQVNICELAQAVDQSQYLGNLLAERQSSDLSDRHTAIVLADEHLLFPVLYAIPEAVRELNITMGFPLKQTHIYHLLLSINRLIRQSRQGPSGISFPYNNVLELINNPYIHSLAPDELSKLEQKITKENQVYSLQEVYLKDSWPSLIRHIFDVPLVADACIPYFVSVFETLLKDAHERKEVVEAEFIFQFYKQFNLLREILEDHPTELSIYTFTRIFQETIRKVKIPFEGEPLLGIQIMGFLETRLLDFDTIYLLGANEGQLPDTSSGNSFIPYNLRKGFGLPTFEEKDTIYAYHFFRLIQRASNVHLIYHSSEAGEGKIGEVSRFIRQIRFFLKKEPNIHLEEIKVDTPIKYLSRIPIAIQQEEQIKEKMQERFGGNRGTLSATAISTYLSCPLRFYFRYIASIEEQDHVEEKMEAGTFGSILHDSLKYVYQQAEGQIIQADLIKELKKHVPDGLRTAFSTYEVDWDHMEGPNFLLREVIEKLCYKVLEKDSESNPFKVIFLEQKGTFARIQEVNGHTMVIDGTFDRVDEGVQTGYVRIIDYKTGRVQIPQKAVPIHELFENDKYKEVLQGYLYLWLFRHKFPEKQARMGFYRLKEMNKGISYLNKGALISNEELDLFEQHLMSFIEKLFHADFTQTQDESKCRICPYKGICNRGRR